MIAPTVHAQMDLDAVDLTQDIDAPLDDDAANLGEITLTKIDLDELEVSLEL